MNFDLFQEQMKDELTNYYGVGEEIRFTQVRKNNGLLLHGISILEEREKVHPTIYMNAFLKEWEEGRNIREIAGEILAIHKQHPYSLKNDFSFFKEFDKVKNHIIYRVINYEKNKELLEQVPHITILDLACIFYYKLPQHLMEHANILIYHNHCQLWQKTAEELYEIAKKNTPKLEPPCLQSMEWVMKRIFMENLKEECQQWMTNSWDGLHNMEIDEDPLSVLAEEMVDEIRRKQGETNLYVLGNEQNAHGAACMLYPNVLAKTAEVWSSDIYIIPSSIHETILLTDEGKNREALLEMVQEVNDTQVAPEDVLSYQVYHFSRESGKIGIAKGI